VRSGGGALARRARHVLVGAALIGIPLVGSEVAARIDYFVTREIQARRILDGLALYVARETVYPDTLAELVKTGDLESVPEPAIGFGFLYDAPFRYQNFGTSFILEFPAPRWVECAYTPPFADEEEDVDSEPLSAETDADEALASDRPPDPSDERPPNPADADYPADAQGSGDSLDEAWSCPSKPPELW
jgi:hypothetical protein